MFEWLRDRAVHPDNTTSLREVLVKAFREQEDILRAQEEEEARQHEKNPTRLMLMLNSHPTHVDFRPVAELVFDQRDWSWMNTLDWVWPAEFKGPAGMTCFHIAANKIDTNRISLPTQRFDVLKWMFIVAIQRGFQFARLTNTGSTLLHLIVTYANHDMILALRAAEDHVFEHHPEIPHDFYPNWAVQDGNGRTPLQHFIASRGHTAKSEESQNMFDFLKARLKEAGWHEEEITKHENEQVEKQQAMPAKDRVKPGARMKHLANRPKSPFKRRRVDDGAARTLSTIGAARAPAAGCRAPASSPFDRQERRSEPTWSNASEGWWQHGQWTWSQGDWCERRDRTRR